MAKLFSRHAGRMFGEAFVSDMLNRRRLAQDQQQFERQMGLKEREAGLMNIYRESLMENARLDNLRGDKTLELNIIKEGLVPVDPSNPPGQDQQIYTIGDEKFTMAPKFGGIERTITDYENLEKGLPVIYGVTDDGRKYRLGLGRPFKDPNATGDKTTPYITDDKLWTAEQNFLFLKGKESEFTSEKDDAKITLKNEKGEDYEVTREEFKAMRKGAFEDIIHYTDERAKQLNSVYKNFDMTFRNYLALASDGKYVDGELYKLTPDNIDQVVSRDMKGQPKDAIREMKRLLKTRIFE